jgi:HlyD family secretion protein
MKSRRNQIIIVIVALVVIGIVVAVLSSRANAQTANTPTVQTATVSLGNISSSVVAAGTVRAKQSATLAWQNTGSVGAVDVQAGDVVTAGQELASLSVDQMPQNVISAESDLAAAQQALDTLLTSTTPQATALQNLQNAQTALSAYQDNFPSIQAMAEANVITATAALKTAQDHRKGLDNGRATQAMIDVAQAKYDQAKAALKVAQRAYDAVKGLPEKSPIRNSALLKLNAAQNAADSALGILNWYTGTPTPADFAAADTAVAQAQQALNQAQQAYDLVKNGPDPTKLASLQAAVTDAQTAYDLVKNGPNPDDVAAAKARIAADQATINTMKITAPFSGTVTDVSVLVHDQVSSGTTAFRIDDLTHMLIDLSVSELDIPNIQLDQAATITFDAIPTKTYQGKVVVVSQTGTSSQGVVNFTVTVEVTNPDSDIHPGMTAAVNVITATHKNVLIVPSRAVRTTTSGGHTVVILSEGKQTTVPVTVGLTDDINTEISGSGIQQGDTVVLR